MKQAPHSHPREVPANPDHWSASSKRSLIFLAPPEQYEDINYHCTHCEKSAVFTAADQKLMFEHKKAYIWQRRYLCPSCFQDRRQIERDIRQCQTRWRDDKRKAQCDREFLLRWLGMLERHPEYGGRRNHAGLTMLRRLIATLD